MMGSGGKGGRDNLRRLVFVISRYHIYEGSDPTQKQGNYECIETGDVINRACVLSN